MIKKILFLSFILLTSCEENAGWLDEMDYTPKLTVNAFWSTENDDQQLVSVHATGISKVDTIKDATFQLTVNGQPIDSIFYTTHYNYYDGISDNVIYSSSKGNYYLKYHFKPGDEVCLQVQSKDQTVEAQTEVPYPIEITGVDTLHIVKYKDGEAQNYVRLMIHLHQPEEMDGTQYFRLEIDNTTTWYLAYCNTDFDFNIHREVRDNIIDWVNDYHYSTKGYDYDSDIALKSFEQNSGNDNNYILGDLIESPKNIYGIFRNSVFKNGEYTLTVDTETNNMYYYNEGAETFDQEEAWYKAGYETRYNIKVYTLPRIEYLYLNALSALSCYDNGSISSNPPVVPSNIEGGTGLFSVSAKAEYNIIEGSGQLLSEGDKIE